MHLQALPKWASRTMIFSAALLALTILSGCSLLGTKTILIEPGTAVRTNKPIRTELFVPDKDGKPILATGVIPAGAAVVVPLKNVEAPKVETITFTEVEKEKIGTWREEQPEAVEKILRVMAGKGQLNAADQAILNQYVKK